MYRISLAITGVDEEDIDTMTGTQVKDYEDFLGVCSDTWYRLKKVEEMRHAQAKLEGPA